MSMSAPDTQRKMLANRKVVAFTCASCGAPFHLGDEVCACSDCRGYHHWACWTVAGRCQPASGAIPSEAGEAAAADTAGISGANGVREVAGTAVMASPDTAPAPAVDQRSCPKCGKAIKREALKCRFCGEVLDEALAQRVEKETVPDVVLEEATKKANQSIWVTLLGGLVCFFAVPAGISSGRQALKLLEPYPQFETSVRTRARIGVAIGWFMVVMWVLGLIARFSSASGS